MNDKIQPIHLERPAYVYIRQSTPYQVRNNQESGRRQYELKGRAEQLGFSNVIVIDDDLGISGTGTKERPGFGRLLAAVCEGGVGAVLAMEASRLARNNRDWHHLIDLCVFTDTLVIDADGVYNPRLLNDRLLLGLKGTMSEFELGLLRQRAQEAYREKIQRGEVLYDVPIGYVRTETNGVEMAADRQVQEAIRGVFEQFRRLGSVRQVLLWYRQERILVCSYQRQADSPRKVVWKLPVYSRLLSILKNPIYAGAFAYGRTRTRSVMVEGRALKTSGHEVPRAEWIVLINNHHPGYIGWEEYLNIQQQLANNVTKHHPSLKGPARKGPALLAGLLRCARCGRKLHVTYTGSDGRVPRYACRGGHINHGTKLCLSFGGLKADETVSSTVLEALQPLGIEAALKAYDTASQGQDQKNKALSLALEKARYEAERARRQYDAVEPENRLVAAELEARWNVALAEVTKAEEQLAAATAQITRPPLTEEQRSRMLQLGSDLQLLWNHPECPVVLKKRVLRTVIEEIIVDVDEPASELVFTVHWAGGVHTSMRVKKNRSGQHGRRTDREVVDLIRELALIRSDASIALILNRLGYEKMGMGSRLNS